MEKPRAEKQMFYYTPSLFVPFEVQARRGTSIFETSSLLDAYKAKMGNFVLNPKWPVCKTKFLQTANDVLCRN